MCLIDFWVTFYCLLDNTHFSIVLLALMATANEKYQALEVIASITLKRWMVKSQVLLFKSRSPWYRNWTPADMRDILVVQMIMWMKERSVHAYSAANLFLLLLFREVNYCITWQVAGAECLIIQWKFPAPFIWTLSDIVLIITVIKLFMFKMLLPLYSKGLSPWMEELWTKSLWCWIETLCFISPEEK